MALHRVTRMIPLLAATAGACDDSAGQTFHVAGIAEKGPFTLGSTVRAAEIGEAGEAGPNIATSAVHDDIGQYAFEVRSDRAMRVEVVGSYFDELNGAPSQADVTLRSLIAWLPAEGDRANVNVLTELAYAREIALLEGGGFTVDGAIHRAEDELRAALPFLREDIGELVPAASSSIADPSQLGRSPAVLLAVSSVLLQAARSRFEAGDDDALPRLLDELGQTLARSGSFSRAQRRELERAANEADVCGAAENLARWYLDHGWDLPVPDVLDALPMDRCPACGDGVLDPRERCDDGNDYPLDLCNLCELTSCGDGIVQIGEECDDANDDPLDECDDCRSTYCGDGIIQDGEACDDGNDDALDECADCQPTFCGDGFVQHDEDCDDGLDAHCVDCRWPCGDGIIEPGERCDDGNDDPLDECDGCQLTRCGDGVVQHDESCDDGEESATCDDDCTAAECGDGVLNIEAGEVCDHGAPDVVCNDRCGLNCGDGVMQDGEICDDGGDSATCDLDCTLAECGDHHWNAAAGELCDSANRFQCTADCTIPFCGNGIVDGANETCDDGGESATCNANCKLAGCGDGVLNRTAGEECDCGLECGVWWLNHGTPTCNVGCTLPACGDGLVNTLAGEDCDDGAASATCDGDCTVPACGDAVLNALAGEACDEGVDTAACDRDCTEATCGDGVVNRLAGERCDDGGASASCDALCLTLCGNGAVDAGEACDDGAESAACDADCTNSTCGDGVVNRLAGEECDDGNAEPGDTCEPDCTRDLCAGAADCLVARRLVREDEPYLLRAGDFDADGDVDLVAAVAGKTGVVVLFGDGTGGFVRSATYGMGSLVDDLALGDLDEDGALDIVATSGGRVYVLLGDGRGGVGSAQSERAIEGPSRWADHASPRMALGDFDGDGHADVAVTRPVMDQVQATDLVVMAGDGTGALGAPLPFELAGLVDDIFGPLDYILPIGVHGADVDDDGSMDLLVTMEDWFPHFYRPLDIGIVRNGGGAWTTDLVAYLPDAPSGLAGTCDWVADGHLDLMLPGQEGLADFEQVGLRYEAGNGDGTFGALEQATATFYRWADCHDLDGDGVGDILAIGQFDPDDLVVRLGDGNGGARAETVHTGLATFGRVFADFDGNGRDDVAGLDQDLAIVVLLSTY